MSAVLGFPAAPGLRRRLDALGPQTLATGEILGLLLAGSGDEEDAVQLGQGLLEAAGSLFGLYGLLVERPGLPSPKCKLPPAKARLLRLALELGRRLSFPSPAERPTVTSPGDAFGLVWMDMAQAAQEQMRVILLDTRNRAIGIVPLYQGSLSTAVVRVGEIFREAVRQNAAAIIVLHSHPSGDPSPSPEDVSSTKAIVSTGKVLDIEVLDHLIVGGSSYVSLKERGLGF
jgi:DNA repair protein RadC